MTNVFLPRLNAFIELLKETHRIHADHISRLGEWQKELTTEQRSLLKLLLKEASAQPVTDGNVLKNTLSEYSNYSEEFERSARAFRAIFQQYIEDTNLQLGMFSNHWGGYIESLGVQYMLNYLRREYNVHTSCQKFKRFWEKNKSIEIDLLAVSNTHAYIVAVKNQLKPETFIHLLKVMDGIREKVPEYAHLILQPVFVCMHADKTIVHSTTMSGLWIVRYKGFDREHPSDSFEWLRRD